MKKNLFIVFNIVLVMLIILVLIRIPYGFIFVLGLFLPILLIVDINKYMNHIQKYPLNDYNEYKFKVFQDKYADFDETKQIYYIKVKYKNGIYTTVSGNKSMRFDMTKCIFPKSYIRAYFVRNIHFSIVNRRKLSLRRLATSLRVDPKYPYKNLKIAFIKNRKEKEYWIVKNSKTKLNILVADIIGNPFTNMVMTNRYHHEYDNYRNISEKYYVNIKGK